jgi:hypothetical protein
VTCPLKLINSLEVEALRSDVSERRSQLEWLRERLEEIDVQKKEAMVAIVNAKRTIHIQKNSTRAEVFNLRGKFSPTRRVSHHFLTIHQINWKRSRICICSA